jgi:hypothetical protein
MRFIGEFQEEILLGKDEEDNIKIGPLLFGFKYTVYLEIRYNDCLFLA